MADDPPNMTVVADRVTDLHKALKQLADTKVMVGIPSDSEQPHVGTGVVGTQARTGRSGIGNAALLYIHEHGSPARNIPARSSLVPGVRESKDKWMEYLKQAGKLALQGNLSGVDKALHAAGLTAVSAVKAKIVAGIPPPLAKATIRARQRRSKGSGYRRQAADEADVTPLVDTAQMLNAISYIIRRKKT